MLRAARKGKLERSDLLETPVQDRSAATYARFKALWAAECASFAAREAAKKASSKKAVADADAAPSTKKPKKEKPPPVPSLNRALWPLVKGLWVPALTLAATAAVMSFGSVLLLNNLLWQIETVQACFANSSFVVGDDGDIPPAVVASCTPTLWRGFAFAVGMLLVKVVETLFLGHSTLMMTRIALRVRSALVCALYHKCLRLSGMGNANTGQIQNLMANDTQFLVQLAPAINMVFLAPIQIVASLVWLGLLVGPSFLAGLGALILMVPIQGKVAKSLFALRRKQLKFTDERVKLTNEALQGVRVVKMYGWDGALKAKMAKVRKQELAHLRRTRFISACFSMFIMVQPLVVTVATFCVYVGAGNTLTAPTVVTALAIFALLRLPLAFLPILLVQAGNWGVSAKRITRFLMNKELDADALAKEDALMEAFAKEVDAGIAAPSKTAGKDDDKNGSTAPPAPLQVDACPPSATVVSSPGSTSPDAASTSPSQVRAGDDDGADDGPAVALQGSFYWEVPEVPVAAGAGAAGRWPRRRPRPRARRAGARPQRALPQAHGGARRRAAGGARGVGAPRWRREAGGSGGVDGGAGDAGGDRGGEAEAREAPRCASSRSRCRRDSSRWWRGRWARASRRRSPRCWARCAP